MPSVQDTTRIADISEYLSGQDASVSELFSFGTPIKDIPMRIYMDNASLKFMYDNPVQLDASYGKYTISIEGNWTNGDKYSVFVNDPILGKVELIADWIFQTGDTLHTIAYNIYNIGNLAVTQQSLPYVITMPDSTTVEIDLPATYTLAVDTVMPEIVVQDTSALAKVTCLFDVINGKFVTPEMVASYNKGLTQVSNYVYQLCGYYGVEAFTIAQSSQGQIINHPAPNVLTPVFRWFYYEVGPGNPITDTTTTFTITLNNIVDNSIAVFNGMIMPNSSLGLPVASYSYVLTPNSVTFTFTQPFMNNEVVSIYMAYYI